MDITTTDIKEVYYNGNEVTKLHVNDVLVWTKPAEIPDSITIYNNATGLTYKQTAGTAKTETLYLTSLPEWTDYFDSIYSKYVYVEITAKSFKSKVTYTKKMTRLMGGTMYVPDGTKSIQQKIEIPRLSGGLRFTITTQGQGLVQLGVIITKIRFTNET